jgi:hypothetical protein
MCLGFVTGGMINIPSLTIVHGAQRGVLSLVRHSSVLIGGAVALAGFRRLTS